MSYLTKDTSIHDGAPIECYEFVADHKTWRYTSYHSSVTVAGEVYTPLPITRTAIEVSSVIDSPTTMDFNIPSDHEIARDFCFMKNPRNLKVVVRSVHEGDDYSTEYRVEWTGYFSGSSIQGKWAVIKTASIIRTALNGYLSSVYYQKSCNHVLYDERCKVLREDFTETAEVLKIQGQIITVDDMVFDEDELINGVMTNTRTGEQQGIITNENNVLRIGYPFFDLQVGDTVELTLGCDHLRLSDCKNRFNNTENYGGFDFIPEVNPFEKLVYTTATRTEVSKDGTVVQKPLAEAGHSTPYQPGGTSQSDSWFGGFTRPKPTSSNVVSFTNSASEGSGNIPTATLGSTVSAVLGRKRVANHNLIWTGNLQPVIETVTSTTTSTEEVTHPGGYVETITTTETTYTTTTVGYTVDLLLGVCLGPDVHLVGILVNGERIWEGDAGPERTQLTIDPNETFLNGATVIFSGGQYDQAPDPDISVPDFPGHVGVATVLIKNMRADLSMSQVSFEVVRCPNPLSLDAEVNRDGDDLNIVSALVEVITNEWGWGGLDISNVDTSTMTTMASVTKNEGNFCSIKIDNAVSIGSVINAIQQQADMVVFEDPEVAKVTGKLVRFDHFTYHNFPRFTNNNIRELRNFEKEGWQYTVERARGMYTERDAEYNVVPVFLENAANISQSGRGKKTATINYQFVPTRSLAASLLARDLGKVAAPSFSFELLTNRDGATLLPGDIISVTWSDASILNVPMMVGSVRKQDILNNNVVLKLKQVKFPLTTANFGSAAAYDPGFDPNPTKPTGAQVLTAPYFMARARNGISSREVNPLVFPLFLPYPANSFQASFNAYISNLPNSSGNVPLTEGAPYSTLGFLNGAIDQYDGLDDGIIDSVEIDGVINPANLFDVGEQGVRDGRVFLIIDSEILSFESVTESGGVYTLHNVHRALLDTVPADHSDNVRVFVVANNFSYVGQNGFTVPVGFTPDWNIVSNGIIVPGKIADGYTFSGGFSPSKVRTLLPPRPHNTKINGSRSSTPAAITEGDSVTVTWATRARTNLKVALTLDAAESPEVNGSETQKHRVYHQSGVTVTDIGGAAFTGNTATFNMPNVTNGAGSIFVVSEIVLGGVLYTSFQSEHLPVTVSSP